MVNNSLISVFWSDDKKLKAEVSFYLVPPENEKEKWLFIYTNKYYDNDILVKTISYAQQGLQYHENAAEDYVSGVSHDN
jgi:hypothetical protein